MTSQDRTGPSDYGTNERHKRGVVEPELTGRGHAVRMRAKDSCELDRLLMTGRITGDEWSAGEAFARRLHAAKMMGMATANLQRVGGGGHISDRQANALIEVTDTHAWLDHMAGERVRKLVTHVCLSETRLDAQGEVDLLRVGLRCLLDMSEASRPPISVRDLSDLMR